MSIRIFKITAAFLLFCSILICQGCSVQKTSGEKLSDVEFTVVNEEDIPAELKGRIDEKKEDSFRLTYGDQGYLYIAKGYGRQKTSGYSIEVTSVYQTENAVCMRTELIGPQRDEEIIQKATYPYVVIKIEYTEKNVVFK